MPPINAAAQPRRRLPAEWEPQTAMLLAWPNSSMDWAPHLAEVEPVFAKLGALISQYQPLWLLSSCPTYSRQQLIAAGARSSQIHCLQADSDDVWLRDCGPITVLHNGQPVLLDFCFNGWGLKYPAALDNTLNRRLCQQGAFGSTPLYRLPLILEGGSIETNGRGTLITTASCLEEANRNPAYSRYQLGRRLQRYLGCRHIHWLEHGRLAGDDTDGHIDTLVRFAPDGSLLYQSCDAPGDEHYPDFNNMAAELASWRDAASRPYRLRPLPWPAPQYDDQGQRLPATYANYVVINGAVILPTYGCPADDGACRALQQAFPKHKLHTIDARPLIWQHGSIHCLTMPLFQEACI